MDRRPVRCLLALPTAADSGASGSTPDGVVSTGGPVGAHGPVVWIAFSPSVARVGTSLTHARYAALSMRDGGGFAKKLVGASGDDRDSFTLTTAGRDAHHAVADGVGFALATTASPTLRWATS